MKKKPVIIVSVEPKLKEAIREASAAQGLQMSDLVRMCVIEYLRRNNFLSDPKA